MKPKIVHVFAAIMAALILIAVPLRAADAPATTEPSEEEEGKSLTEINKKLTNPIADFWSVSFQQNNYKVVTVPGQEDRWSSNLQFQPVLPVELTKD